jgi:chorismate synthase
MKYIKSLYSLEKLYIPIEILIYNIVNFSPSPLQADIILDLKSSIEQYQSLGLLPSSRSTIISIKTTEIAPKCLNSNDLDIKNINKNKDIRKGTIFTKYN